MTMLIESLEQVATVTHEPTAADKIQRILYRLDHGIELTYSRMKRGDNFCVLGLFAEESGLGYWNGHDCYVVNGEPNSGSLHTSISEYYGLASETGIFRIQDLPKHIVHDLNQKMAHQLGGVLSSISVVNDEFLIKGYKPNQILADIIRSGAIFLEKTGEVF